MGLFQLEEGRDDDDDDWGSILGREIHHNVEQSKPGSGDTGSRLLCAAAAECKGVWAGQNNLWSIIIQLGVVTRSIGSVPLSAFGLCQSLHRRTQGHC